MKLITLYEIHRWDGGEYQIYRGEAASSEAAAKEIANKHDRVMKTVHRVYDSRDDFAQNKQEAIAKRALAKLTPEEIDALGLSK